MIKGRVRHTPRKRYCIMFVRSTPHSSVFVWFRQKGNATKATTPNCVPQEKDTCEGAVCKLALCLVCWSLKYSCYINSSSGKSDFIMYIFMVMAEGLFCLCVSRLIERDIWGLAFIYLWSTNQNYSFRVKLGGGKAKIVDTNGVRRVYLR